MNNRFDDQELLRHCKMCGIKLHNELCPAKCDDVDESLFWHIDCFKRHEENWSGGLITHIELQERITEVALSWITRRAMGWIKENKGEQNEC